jgi:hypothetical protein
MTTARVLVSRIVLTSILSSIEGKFGDHHSILQRLGRELFIKPFMAIYWCPQVCKGRVPPRGRLDAA